MAVIVHCLLVHAAAAQAPPSDIYLIPLTRSGSTWTLGTPVNATARTGYDNQPFFLPDGSGLLFTSIREDRQADTYRYDVTTGAVTRVTSTPESEYSPTPIPHRPGWFSVIRVEADSAQRLWAFRMDGSAPELVVADVKPVGYHAWIDGGGLAMFVLGPPATAQVMAAPHAAPRTVAANIGRALARMEGRSSVLISQLHAGSYQISRLDLPSYTMRPIARLPRGDFFAFHNGSLFAADSSRVLAWRVGRDTSWAAVGDLSPHGLRNVTRLAVSPDGRRLAVVANDR